MQHPETGVSIKDRQHLLTVYRSCFIGSEAVDWLVNVEQVFNRSEAILLGQKLQQMRLIQHVTKQQPFVDKGVFYEFMVRFVSRRITIQSPVPSRCLCTDIEMVLEIEL
jgi:hypothetical protein